jgi:hypothetical protein
MTETLHAGGTGLGRDDTTEDPVLSLYRQALDENAALHDFVIALHKSCQWRTFGMAITFIAGFMLACVLIGVMG